MAERQKHPRMAAPGQVDVANTRWMDRANCLGADPELFFPQRGASTEQAKEVCRGCVVQQACLDYALLRSEKYGIWGGLSERQRRHIRRDRTKGAA